MHKVSGMLSYICPTYHMENLSVGYHGTHVLKGGNNYCSVPGDPNKSWIAFSNDFIDWYL